MTWTADKRYGRRGGGWTEATKTEAKPEVPVLAAPAGPESLRSHLIVEHRMPHWVVDAHGVDEWLAWHTAEHKQRVGKDFGHKFLGHRHDQPTALEVTTSTEHAANLRAARDGKLPPAKVQEVVDRAAYAAQRRAQGLALSAYDRECSEVAKAIADRAARKAKRRRKAA